MSSNTSPAPDGEHTPTKVRRFSSGRFLDKLSKGPKFFKKEEDEAADEGGPANTTAPLLGGVPDAVGSKMRSAGSAVAFAASSGAKGVGSAAASAAKGIGSAAGAVAHGVSDAASAAGGAISLSRSAPEEKKEEPHPAPAVNVNGPVYGSADIAIVGVKGDKDTALRVVRERGFVVHVATKEPEEKGGTMSLAVGMGPKLLKKMAVERELPDDKPHAAYARKDLARMAGAALEVVERSGLEYNEAFLLNSTKGLEGVMSLKSPDAVEEYYGSGIALYFGWLSFYTKALAVPAVAGVVLFLRQLILGEVDTPLVPGFCVLVSVWGTLFLEFWKRWNSATAFKWGVFGVEDEEISVKLAAEADMPKASPGGKLCFSMSIVFLSVYLCVRAMLYCIWLSDHAHEIYGDSLWRYGPTALYSVVPVVAVQIYSRLAAALNVFEDHPTESRRKDALILKMFAFQFVNSYCALFYIAFWLQDFDRLRTMLFSMMVTKQLVNLALENGVPQALRMHSERKKRKGAKEQESQVEKVVFHAGTLGPEELQAEVDSPKIDIGDDYLEMVIQFGYCTMFAVAFPLAPLLALMNNKVEYLLDLRRLTKSRRPRAHVSSTVGSWYTCLEAMSFVAVLTNLLIAVLVSENTAAYVPDEWEGLLETTTGKMVVAVAGEHLLLLLKVVMAGLIEDVPLKVRKGLAKLEVQRKKDRARDHLIAATVQAAEAKGASKEATAAAASAAAVAATAAAAPRETPEEADRRAAIARLGAIHRDHESSGRVNPNYLLLLAFLPYLAMYYELSALWTLPCALVVVSYMVHRKDKADTGVALGIVSDAKVLKLVTKYLPSWFQDSEVERVEWINKLLNKLWTPASGATQDIVATSVQPLLDSYRPPGINTLTFSKVSLGSIPPRVVGMRVLDMQQSVAVLEMEVRWASNAQFVVEVGRKGFPLTVEVSKIRFAGRMRVELAPLVPKIPCFGALAATFMEKPFVDFAFKLGGMDVMSLGPGDLSVGNAVSATIKSVIQGMMLYPLKLVIPIMDDQDIEGLANPSPTGVLQLTVVGCDHLRKADSLGKSDPFVKMAMGPEKFKTKVIKGTLDPRWNAQFDLLVYDAAVQSVSFQVFDWDVDSNDSLGTCELKLSALQSNKPTGLNIPLSGTPTGSLLLNATYVPLKGAAADKAPDPDILLAPEGAEEAEIGGSGGGGITDAMVGDEASYAVPGEESAGAGAGGKVEEAAVGPAAAAVPIDPTDKSFGVLTVTGVGWRGVKASKGVGVRVTVGNSTKETPTEDKKVDYTFGEVYRFLVRGARTASVDVALTKDQMIGSDSVVGTAKVWVEEVVANDNDLEGEWVLQGDKAAGSVCMRLRWSPAE